MARRIWQLGWAVLWLVCACDNPHAPPLPPAAGTAETEAVLRKRLGIPAGAEKVMIFAQSSHMDLDWRRTFASYYDLLVGNILLSARKWLDANPSAQYAVAEMAFVQHHLKVHPEEAVALRTHVARGALRVVGGGLTSPDTLLPESELLARDYLYGLRVAEDDLGAKPTTAWLADSFGHGATVPDLLAAAGLGAVAFARIDGAPTLFEQLIRPDEPFKPGSTAKKLQDLGSADFVWQGPGGGTVLGHFLAGHGLYCMGDDLDYDEAVQIEGGHSGLFRGKDPSFIDARIAQYHKELGPWSKTPYELVPVGCDFMPPKEGLLGYLKGYNERMFALTGIYTVAASFEDYAKLVAFHKAKLPTLQGELSPVYMGFFGSRPAVKAAVRRALRPYLAAELLADRDLADLASPALQRLVRSNHHDWVTGTSTDDVVAQEQLPEAEKARLAGEGYLRATLDRWGQSVPGHVGQPRLALLNPNSLTSGGLVEAELPAAALGNGDLKLVYQGTPLPTETSSTQGSPTTLVRAVLPVVAPWQVAVLDVSFGSAPPPVAPVQVLFRDVHGLPTDATSAAEVQFDNGQVRATLAKVEGRFVLTQVQFGGQSALAGPSMQARDYADMGGMWRLGHEMVGCAFTPIELPADTTGATVHVLTATPLLAQVRFAAAGWAMEVRLGAADSGLGVTLETAAPEDRTRTLRLHVAGASSQVETSTPFGWVAHPGQSLYQPTFWPAVTFVRVGELAVQLRHSTGAALVAPGTLELLLARDARAEKCDLMGATGSDIGVHRTELRLGRATTSLQADHLAQAWNHPPLLATLPSATAARQKGTAPAGVPGFEVLAGQATVLANKPAERGAGRVQRLVLHGDEPVVLQARPGTATQGLRLVDLAERDRRALTASQGRVTLHRKTDGAVVAIRFGAQD